MTYCVALIAPIVPAAVFGGPAWVAMYTSADAWPPYRIVAVLLVLARFVFVIVRRRALQAYVAVPFLRSLSIAAMMVGSILAVAAFFNKPITLWLFGPPNDPGVGFRVIMAALTQGAYLATLGVIVFELNRAIGEVATAFARLSDRWRSRGR